MPSSTEIVVHSITWKLHDVFSRIAVLICEYEGAELAIRCCTHFISINKARGALRRNSPRGFQRPGRKQLGGKQQRRRGNFEQDKALKPSEIFSDQSPDQQYRSSPFFLFIVVNSQMHTSCQQLEKRNKRNGLLPSEI